MEPYAARDYDSRQFKFLTAATSANAALQMTDPGEATIRRIHASPTRVVLAVAGGGSGAIARLLEVPGASGTLLEAVVPYADESLAAWLGAPPEHACRATTARAMAMVAFEKAKQYRAAQDQRSPWPVAGVACTASIASDRPKRGEHRAHVAVQTATWTRTDTLVLAKGARGRAEEERIVADFVLQAVARACDLDEQSGVTLSPNETIETVYTVAPPEHCKLLGGAAAVATSTGDKPLEAAQARLVFPGAFHPRHRGHRRMAQLAAERLGDRVVHEISITNVDKPPLDFTVMRERAEQFAADETMWFTRAATFAEKAALFPGATFVVGIDTIARIAEARYYHDDPARRDAAIAAIVECGCRFLVFGRKTDGGFEGLRKVTLPQELIVVCDEVPEESFREDVSSTELRRQVADVGNDEI